MTSLKYFAAIFIFGISCRGFAAPEALDEHLVFEAEGGSSFSTPLELNAYRNSNESPSTTMFNNMQFIAGTIGFHLLPRVVLAARYEMHSQNLSDNQVNSGAATMSDSFVYNPAYLMILFPRKNGNWLHEFGLGVGYATRYEFHMKFSGTGEDVVWKANPTTYIVRGCTGYAFSKNFALIGELAYEWVSSNVQAAQNYNTTLNGSAITSGQTLNNAVTNTAVKVDWSGVRYTLGLRISI